MTNTRFTQPGETATAALTTLLHNPTSTRKTGAPMAVLDYRPFSHRRDEMGHLIGPRPRGERRRNSRRAHRRKIKRLETRTWRLDTLHQTTYTYIDYTPQGDNT